MTNGTSSPLRRKRGGGPKTDAGKKASSQNALKRGAYAQALILPGEDEQQFRDLLGEFNRDFRPLDMAERSMIHDLAVVTWKKHRFERIEYNEIVRLLRAELKDGDFPDKSKMTPLLAEHMQYEGFDFKEYHRAFSMASQWLEEESYPEAFDVLLKNEYPILFSYFEGVAAERLKYGVRPAEWADAIVYVDIGLGALFYSEVPFYKYATELFVKGFQPISWAAENQDEAWDQIQGVKSARILGYYQTQVGRRALDDLDRAFYRTLNEFRKHQQWRRQRSEIDLNPEIPTDTG